MKKTVPASKNSRLKKTTIVSPSKKVAIKKTATKKPLVKTKPATKIPSRSTSSSPGAKTTQKASPKTAINKASSKTSAKKATTKHLANPPLITASNKRRRYSLLQVFGAALRLIAKKPKPIFLTSIFYFIVVFLIAVISNLISGKHPFSISFGFNFITPTWENLAYALFSILIALIFGVGITYYYNKILEGNRSERASTLSKSFSRLIPSMLSNISIFLIMTLVLAPFIILSISTSVFAIYQAITNTDFQALFNFLTQFQFGAAWGVFWMQINPSLFILSLFWAVLGVVFALTVTSRYYFATNIVIITKAKVGEALSASAILTKDNILRTIFFQIIVFFLNICGGLFFGVGLIFTIPLTTLAQLYAYHSLVGDLPNV